MTVLEEALEIAKNKLECLFGETENCECGRCEIIRFLSEKVRQEENDASLI